MIPSAQQVVDMARESWAEDNEARGFFDGGWPEYAECWIEGYLEILRDDEALSLADGDRLFFESMQLVDPSYYNR